MTDDARRRFDEDLEAARRATGRKNLAEAWAYLEEAHVLSQPWAWPHVRVHWLMFVLAVRARDTREAVGQVVRALVAAPGSLAGRYPRGNTGRASVGLTTPMPIPNDLVALLPPR